MALARSHWSVEAEHCRGRAAGRERRIFVLVGTFGPRRSVADPGDVLEPVALGEAEMNEAERRPARRGDRGRQCLLVEAGHDREHAGTLSVKVKSICRSKSCASMSVRSYPPPGTVRSQ